MSIDVSKIGQSGTSIQILQNIEASDYYLVLRAKYYPNEPLTGRVPDYGRDMAMSELRHFVRDYHSKEQHSESETWIFLMGLLHANYDGEFGHMIFPISLISLLTCV